MLKKWVKEYILKNKYDLSILLIMLVVGLLVGAGVYIFSDATVKEVVILKATEVFKLSSSKEYIETNVIANGIRTNILTTCILALASVTLFGRYIIEMMTLLKGALLSIYAIILFNVLGMGYGLVAVFLLVILVNMIYIPALLFLSLMFMEIHFNIFKTKNTAMTLLDILSCIMKTITGYIVMFSSVIVEQVASLVVLKLFLKMN